MLILTRRAISAIEDFMRANDKAGFGVRIMAEAGGCSGPRYAMRLEEQPGDGDTIVEIRDVRVFLDQDAQSILTGATVDYSDAEDDHGFNFTLAQPASSCTKPAVGQSCSCKGGLGCGTPVGL